jgi:hypothetical protein
MTTNSREAAAESQNSGGENMHGVCTTEGQEFCTLPNNWEVSCHPRIRICQLMLTELYSIKHSSTLLSDRAYKLRVSELDGSLRV